MEVHLSQEDRDPLALHSVAAVTTVFDNENKHTDKDGSMDHDHQEEFDYAPEAKNGGGAAGGEEEESMRDGPTTSAGLPVSKTTMRDSSSPSALRALSPSPLPPPIPSNHASSALEAEALPTYKSSSLPMVDPTLPSTNSQSSSTAASMKKMNSIYLASPSLSPSPSAYEPQDMGWTPSLSTLLPLTSETGDDVDAEMASPIEPTAPIPFGHTHLDPITDGYESGAGTETETIADLTTRTIKKFKSLRRAHTSSHSRQQQQQQQDSNYQEDAHPSPPVRSGSISRPSGGGTDTVPSTPSKAKIMKRSKTIVFRPEVTMQPLSSKNVIPPWNRIPSFANSNTNNGNSNSNNAGAVPISPISPTTPHSATTMSLSSEHSTPNTATSDHHTASPTSFDMDDQYYQQQQQPRKLGMSQSKTMSSISTTPSWSFGNTNNSATADTAATAVVAATTEHPTLPAGSLAALSFSAMSTNSSNSAGRSSLNRNGSISNTGARSMSISSGITPTTTLVAPWNRANAHGETNTHLHSLIKISGQLSPSLQSPTMNSPFIPVELGRSFHKKESQAQKSPSNRGAKDRAVPVLTHPPEARNRNPETTSLSFLGGSGGVKGGSGGGGSGGGGGRARKPGMTHSVSAPGGFLPIMTVSAPDTSSSPSSDDVSEAVSTEDASRASVKAAVTKKRVSLHSPSLSTKQPIGILKNAQRGARKASLTVPGAVMFPVQSSLTTSLAVSSAMGSASALSSPSSSPSTTPIPPGGGGTHGAGTLATTFKIVMDADTIVALQVLEDSSFVLTMPELRSRVKAKLTKSNIQLPDKFDLLWTAPTNSMTLASPSPSPLPLPSPLTPTSGMSAMSIHQTANAVAVAAALDQGVMLKTDEDLHRAIHASRNHKVTLRCVL
ncbi:hypothetical protein BGZ95_008911 [Linnemannia exigua]|uniref:Uncharacterized protein n=1 Tax=Linnemannia exigua TaxID=604196 RepID=A0AAD4DDY4_9FUNG|nr:hypothetical protein BGZ95_008911 [Linnemannia exigua]